MKGFKELKKRAKASPAFGIVLSFLAMTALVLLVYFVNVPNPNIFLLTALTVLTSLYGYGAGVACGAVMIAYSMFFFSTDHSFFVYNEINLKKIIVIIIGTIISVLFIGRLKRIEKKAQKQLVEMNRALVRENEELEAASCTDTLTGIMNRFALRKNFGDYIGLSVSLVMLDVDDFKSLNDNYDHITGDRVLKNLGTSLIDIFGKGSSYRYGGDEFLVILKGTGEDDLKLKLDKLMKENSSVESGEEVIEVHFSVGYVIGSIGCAADLRSMLKQADANLYDSKHRGKNRYTGSSFVN